MLDKAARSQLRGLSKENADTVARHLIMAGRLLDQDPETAHAHAQAAVRRAGRIDVVREAAALTSYAVGNYAEALRELRTVRRLSGVDAHRAIEADCERGLGRPERALSIVSSTDPATLTEEDRVELAIVASGARADLGEREAALLALDSPLVDPVRTPELLQRLALVRAERLEELDRTDEAEAERQRAATLAPLDLPDEEAIVFDLDDETDEESEPASDEELDTASADEEEAAPVLDEAPEPEQESLPIADDEPAAESETIVDDEPAAESETVSDEEPEAEPEPEPEAVSDDADEQADAGEPVQEGLFPEENA